MGVVSGMQSDIDRQGRGDWVVARTLEQCGKARERTQGKGCGGALRCTAGLLLYLHAACLWGRQRKKARGGEGHKGPRKENREYTVRKV